LHTVVNWRAYPRAVHVGGVSLDDKDWPGTWERNSPLDRPSIDATQGEQAVSAVVFREADVAFVQGHWQDEEATNTHALDEVAIHEAKN